MKKFFTIGLFALASNFILAQDDGLRKFRFGLKVTPSLNWFKPQEKLISNNGVAFRYGGGLVLEYRLAKIISFQSGIQIDFGGGKVKYNNGTTLSTPSSNSVSYYYNNLDDKIVTYDSTLSPASNTHYQLNSRTYTISYITIPLTLKMKTKEIGSLTYYGQFGINNSFRWKATANDDVQPIKAGNLGTNESKQKIDVTKDVSLYTAALNIGMGAEMNLSGSTSLTFGVNYLGGFLNVVKDGSKYLDKKTNDAAGVTTHMAMPQQITSNAVVLMVGVLF